MQSEVLADEAHQHVLTVGEPPAVVEQPQDEQHDQQEEGRGQGADDDKCHVCHFLYCMNSGAKLVGKTERPSPLLEMFSTNLEKLLFMRYFAVFRRCHGIVGGKETSKSGAVGKAALLDDESYRVIGFLQQLGSVLYA